MASVSRDRNGDGVQFVHEKDGSITAVDEETGVALFGETKAEALRMLAEALELHKEVGSRSRTRILRNSGSTQTTSSERLRNFPSDRDSTRDASS